jgi:hypothetical protein
MHDAVVTHIDNPGPLTLASRWRMTFYVATAVGIVSMIAALAVNANRAWNVYLVAYFMFLCFGVGGLFFTALQYAVNASWVVVTRRVSSGLSAFLPAALILYIGIIIGAKQIFPWANGPMFEDPLKLKWLSLPWVAARDMAIILIWIFFAWKIIGFALKQDETGDVMLTRKAVNWSIAFMPVFAFSFTIISFDLIMSLQPHWYSTLFAIYTFAGMFQSTVALITLIFLWMKRNDGPLSKVATPSHTKDLGTFIFAFTIFMTYIGFSQYMLIYYANMPEETIFFMKRSSNGWEWLFLALPLFKFILPFFGMLSQGAKKTEKWLMAVCVIIFVGQFLDIYWLVMPAMHETFAPTVWMEIGIWLGFAGIFGLTVSRFYSRYSVLPVKDPYMLESANWRFWE